jgi:hypothetical protein
LGSCAIKNPECGFSLNSTVFALNIFGMVYLFGVTFSMSGLFPYRTTSCVHDISLFVEKGETPTLGAIDLPFPLQCHETIVSLHEFHVPLKLI